MQKKKFEVLRGLLVSNSMDQPEFAETVLHRSYNYTSKRLNAISEWSLADVYATMDYSKQPYVRVNEVFPKGGVS